MSSVRHHCLAIEWGHHAPCFPYLKEFHLARWGGGVVCSSPPLPQNTYTRVRHFRCQKRKTAWFWRGNTAQNFPFFLPANLQSRSLSANPAKSSLEQAEESFGQELGKQKQIRNRSTFCPLFAEKSSDRLTCVNQLTNLSSSEQKTSIPQFNGDI